LKRIFWIRINTAGVYDMKLGKYRPSPYTMRGVADVLVIKDNFPIFIELKAKGGRQSADQVLFQKHCDAHAIEYHIVRSVDDLVELGI